MQGSIRVLVPRTTVKLSSNLWPWMRIGVIHRLSRKQICITKTILKQLWNTRYKKKGCTMQFKPPAQTKCTYSTCTCMCTVPDEHKCCKSHRKPFHCCLLSQSTSQNKKTDMNKQICQALPSKLSYSQSSFLATVTLCVKFWLAMMLHVRSDAHTVC